MPSSLSNLLYHSKDRKATWLELFFDLIFVVVISKVTHLLAHVHHGHLDPGIWWKMPLMFLPLWWIWISHTTWSNLYDRDSKQHRVATLLIMLQMVVLSTAVDTDWEKTFALFNASYFGLRLTFCFLYFSNRGAHPDNVKFANQRAAWRLFAALISFSSLLFPAPLRYHVLYLGIVLDMLFPIIQARFGTALAAHSDHLIERMGLLIIILMGESVIMLSSGVAEVQWTGTSIMAALSGAIMIGAAWWIYFDSYHRLADEDERLRTGLPLAYPHILTCLGLTTLANMIHHAIHQGLAINEYQILASVGMLLFYLGKQIPYFAKFPVVRINILVNSAITFAICGGSLFLPSAPWILVGFTVAMLCYVLLNLFTTIRKLRTLGEAASAAE